MSTIVQRQPADKVGDDIVSSVLTTKEAQLERGTYEVNTNDRDRRTVEGSILDSSFLQPGGMYGIDIRGERKNGLLTSYSYSMSLDGTNLSVDTNVSLETIA